MDNSEIINFKMNKNSFIEIDNIESICLCGNSTLIKNAEITICIPTYKRPLSLKRAIDSALNQVTDVVYKVIVVDNDDDFSETETSKLLSSYNDTRLIYYKNTKNLGMGGNWNRCGQLVDTNFFSLLHDDDVLFPDYLNSIKKYIRKNSFDCIFLTNKQIGNPFYNVSSISSRKKFLYEFRKKLGRKETKINISDILFFDNIFGPPTCGVTIKTECFLNSGGFNMDYYPSLDWYFFIYCLFGFKCIRINKCVGYYYWEENASLKKEVLDGFMNQRAQVIRSLPEISLSCRIYYSLLKRVFNSKMKTRLEIPFETDSKLYKFLFKIKYFKYRIRSDE